VDNLWISLPGAGSMRSPADRCPPPPGRRTRNFHRFWRAGTFTRYLAVRPPALDLPNPRILWA
jgi:hypothetical protein